MVEAKPGVTLDVVLENINTSNIQSESTIPQEDESPTNQPPKYKKVEGDFDAQFELGVAYTSPNDYTRAMKHYITAAGNGNAQAQNNIGEMFQNGCGVTKDYKKAMEWYFKASEQGNDVSWRNIGKMYFYGYGVNQDCSKAMEWYCKAAEQGNRDAQNDIGDMYKKGHGVTQDYSNAIEWFLKAAEQGDPIAMKKRWSNVLLWLWR